MCGDWDPHHGKSRCTCKPTALRAYRSKLTGPLADRIDITRTVMPVVRGAAVPFDAAETSAVVRERVTAARARQHERFADCSWRLNAHVPSQVLRDRWPLTDAGQRLVDKDLYDGRISNRGAVRVQRLAWTLADLESAATGRDVVPGAAHAETALQLRKGDPMAVRAVVRRAG